MFWPDNTRSDISDMNTFRKEHLEDQDASSLLYPSCSNPIKNMHWCPRTSEVLLRRSWMSQIVSSNIGIQVDLEDREATTASFYTSHSRYRTFLVNHLFKKSFGQHWSSNKMFHHTTRHLSLDQNMIIGNYHVCKRMHQRWRKHGWVSCTYTQI
jgi:hypothetical protein